MKDATNEAMDDAAGDGMDDASQTTSDVPADLVPPADTPTLLVKIFGKDRPGITAGLFDTLAAFGLDVVDIEQVVTRGRMVLCALVTAPTGGAAPRATCGPPCTAGPSRVRMQAEIISGIGDNRPRGEGRSHVTVLGHPLTAESTAAIAATDHRGRRQHRPYLPAREVPGDRGGVRGVRAPSRPRCAPRWRWRPRPAGWTWRWCRPGCSAGRSGWS